MLIHTRSVADKVHDVWRSPGRFTKNPDMVRLPSGRLLLVYSDNDSHWSEEEQVLTILASDDLGRSWSRLAVVDRADRRKGEERLVTPRLSLLADGRLVVVVDHDDFRHFHEDQSSGNWLYWSKDGGATWSPHAETGIAGFEPDRVMELPDGCLAVCTHVMFGDSQEFADIMSVSSDGGQSWSRRGVIAHDGYHRFCEGALVLLHGGEELACVLRENHSAGIPSFVAFSRDMGRNWSAPEMLPFSFHRPYALELPDGRVLATGRHVNGGLGTYGWCGDLHAEAGSYQIGGPRRKYAATLEPDALVIENKPEHECRYTLLPPEGPRSEVCFEAELKLEGPDDVPVAFLSISRLNAPTLLMAPNWVAVYRGRSDTRSLVDLRRYRRVAIVHRRGLLRVLVDGGEAIAMNLFWDMPPGGAWGVEAPSTHTAFGQLGAQGRSFWKKVRFSAVNPRLLPWQWSWEASGGLYPDHYQRTRLVQIHGNHPDQKPGPDHGYSSWLILPDGRISFVDYTNHGDPPGKSHLVGGLLDPADFA